ncbi:MAG: ABC transporter permease [Bacteroidota bacterium]
MTIRKRIILILLIALPSIFSLVVYYTTADISIPFQLAFISEEVFLEISEKSVSMLFMAVASAGFISSFLGLNLIQKHHHENRRLILCGYKPGELVIANLGVLTVYIIIVSIYSSFILLCFMDIDNYPGLLAGIILAGFIYGTYGLAVGSIVRGELEGILLIVLLANIDAGWLQNPIFYADAQNKVIIEYLPAFYPSQTAIASSFSDYSITKSILYSLTYGLVFLLVSLSIFFNKMKLLR